MKLTRFALAAAILTAAAPLFAETWVIDRTHSEALFTLRHVIAKVGGRFDDIDAKIELDQKDLSRSSVEFTMKSASINTGNSNRDDHLRTGDFFDAEKFPTITFKSVSIKPTAKKDVFDVTGDLTIRDVTRRITVPVEFYGIARDPRGNEKAGFTASTTINRKDFGVSWNRPIEAGGLLLSDEVSVTVNIAAAKPKPAPAQPAPAAPGAPAPKAN